MGQRGTSTGSQAVDVLLYTTDQDLVERITNSTGGRQVESVPSPDMANQLLAGNDRNFGVVMLDLVTLAKNAILPVIPAINSIPGVLVVLLSPDGQARLPDDCNLAVRYCRMKRNFPKEQVARMMEGIMKLYRGEDNHADADTIPENRTSSGRTQATPLWKYIATGIASVAIAVPLTYLVLSRDGGEDSKQKQPTVRTVTSENQKVARNEDDGPEEVNVEPLSFQIRSLLVRANAAIEVGEYFEPEKISAMHYYSRALDLAPENEQLNQAISEFIGRIMRDVNKDLKNHRLQAASDTVEKLRRLDPDDIRFTGFDKRLKQQVNVTIAEAKKLAADGKMDKARPMLEEAASVLAIDPSVLTDDLEKARQANREKRLNELSDLAIRRLDQGKLLNPSQDNAKHYLYTLKNMDPDNETLKLGYRELGRQLLRKMDEAMADNNLDAAGKWLSEARLLDVLEQEVVQKSAVLNEAIKKERLRVAAENREKRIQALLDNMSAQIAADKLLEPEQDNARRTLDLLQTMAPDDERTATAAADYNKALFARTDEALQAGNYQRAESMIASADDSVIVANKEQQQQLAALREQLTSRQKKGAGDDDGNTAGGSGDGSTGKDENAEKPVKLVRSVQPDYPSRAVRNEIEGWVHLEFDINSEGATENIAIVKSDPDYIFNSAAIEAVEEFRYEIIDSTDDPDFRYHDEILLRFKLE